MSAALSAAGHDHAARMALFYTDTTPLRRIACRCRRKRVRVFDAFTVALSELRIANLVYTLLIEVPGGAMQS